MANLKDQKDEPKVKVSNNGPYLVSGAVTLFEFTIGIDADGYSYEWRDGPQYPAQENYALCRCGQSKNKPFCDGSHLKANFSGKETASREPYKYQARRIRGSNIELTDAQELCAAARFCDRAGGIWSLTIHSSNPESKRIAIEEARNCPSGRLVVWDKEGKEIEPRFEKSIVIVKDPQEDMNGPIWVRGGITIESTDGNAYEIRNRVTLCRCGKSYNKPFCDGSHCK